nr:MAG TPA: hypothetical protein [Bacteriophage sp.]
MEKFVNGLLHKNCGTPTDQSRLYRITSKDIIADVLSLGKRMWRMSYDSKREGKK